MGAILGNKKRAYLGTGSGPAWTWLAGEQSNSITRTNNLIEVSDKTDDNQRFIGGIKGVTGEITVFADDSNAQQKAVLAALNGGTTVKIFIGTVDESNAPVSGEYFDALINSVGDTNDNGSVASRSISYTRTGASTFVPASE